VAVIKNEDSKYITEIRWFNNNEITTQLVFSFSDGTTLSYGKAMDNPSISAMSMDDNTHFSRIRIYSNSTTFLAGIAFYIASNPVPVVLGVTTSTYSDSVYPDTNPVAITSITIGYASIFSNTLYNSIGFVVENNSFTEEAVSTNHLIPDSSTYPNAAFGVKRLAYHGAQTDPFLGLERKFDANVDFYAYKSECSKGNAWYFVVTVLNLRYIPGSSPDLKGSKKLEQSVYLDIEPSMGGMDGSNVALVSASPLSGEKKSITDALNKAICLECKIAGVEQAKAFNLSYSNTLIAENWESHNESSGLHSAFSYGASSETTSCGNFTDSVELEAISCYRFSADLIDKDQPMIWTFKTGSRITTKGYTTDLWFGDMLSVKLKALTNGGSTNTSVLEERAFISVEQSEEA
jgi:hypothetical protein